MNSFVVLAVLNGAIAAAYMVMAFGLAPRLGLPRSGRYAAVAFFAACGLTHMELAVHGLSARPDWMVSGHMLVIHGVQAVVDWVFVVVALRYLDIELAPKGSRAARRLAAALEIAQAGGWSLDLRTGRWSWTEGLSRLTEGALGRPGSQHHGLRAVTHPSDSAALDQELARAARGADESGEIDLPALLPSGDERIFLVRWQVAERVGDEVVSLAGVVQDVTESRRARAAAQRAQLETARFFELSRDMLAFADASGRLTRVNPAFTRSLGWTSDELTSRPLVEFVHPEDAEATRAETALLQGDQETIDFVNRYRTTAGGYRWIRWSCRGLGDGTIVARAADITEERREEARRATREAVSDILTAEPSEAVALEGVLAELSRRLKWEAATLWLASPDRSELSCDHVAAADSALAAEAVGERLPMGTGMSGTAYESRRPVWSADVQADPRFARKVLAARHGLRGGLFIPLGGDRPIGVLELLAVSDREPAAADVELLTGIGALLAQFIERSRAEAATEAAGRRLEEANEELRRSNAELEQFAYVASHDLSEPLRAISGFVGLLDRRYGGELDARAGRYIENTKEGVTRMQGILDSLLLYSRVNRGGVTSEPVDCSQVIEHTIRALGPAIAETRGRVEVGDLPVVTGDAAQIGQVFQNLIANGLKFRSDDAPRVEVAASREDLGWHFTVRDDGIGIPAEQAERIFKMFQRLHGRDEYPGYGIGLSVTQRIVERHGGRIWFESEGEGRGTTFHFTIPDQAAASRS